MNKIIKLFALSIGFLFVTSCADLNELSPINSIPTNTAFADRASALAAINGVYSDLQDATLAFDGYLAMPQLFTDETVFTGTFPTRLEFGNKNVFPSNATMAGVFSDFYEVINRANNVIAAVPNVEDDTFTPEDRNDAIAQARFLRGQMYFQLVTLWIEVPLILEPTVDVGEVLNVARSSEDAIYAQIIDDLTFARENLTTASSVNFASVQSATAFLARVALYNEDWMNAWALAQEALAGVDLSTVPFLDDQIYSLGFTPTDGNSLAFFYGPAEVGGRYSIAPSQTLIDAFEPGDLRFSQTLELDFLPATPFGVKYPSFADANSGSATDPVYFIRHAEMVLIIAEAAAELGDFSAANAAFDQVRARAGLGPIELTSANFVDAILAERFVEFALEGNFRLLDLRRRGLDLQVLGPLGYDECDRVWPLPQRDIDRNINLMQNDCCNC